MINNDHNNVSGVPFNYYEQGTIYRFTIFLVACTEMTHHSYQIIEYNAWFTHNQIG